MATRYWLGAFAVGFFVLHAAIQLHAGRPYNLLWACHVADLCVGCGLLFRRPTLLAAGVLMLMVGVPLWLISLSYGGAFYPTSVLTHLGGLTVGMLGLRLLGIPDRSWLAAVVLVASLILASRALTPFEFNVNLAFTPWASLGSWLDTLEGHITFLLTFWIVTLWISQYLLECLRIGNSSTPAPRHFAS